MGDMALVYNDRNFLHRLLKIKVYSSWYHCKLNIGMIFHIYHTKCKQIKLFLIFSTLFQYWWKLNHQGLDFLHMSNLISLRKMLLLLWLVFFPCFIWSCFYKWVISCITCHIQEHTSSLSVLFFFNFYSGIFSVHFAITHLTFH